MHWQAGDRELPAPRVTVAGESVLWVDPAEIPAGADISRLGMALAAGLHGERDELMASTAAYSGLRWGELTALTIGLVVNEQFRWGSSRHTSVRAENEGLRSRCS